MFAKYAVAAATCLIAALTPARASSGCLTHSEARQMFPTSHLYWHGKDHCWDASAVATKPARLAHRVLPQERPTPAAVAPKPPDENATIDVLPSVGASSTSANTGERPPASGLTGLRHWPNTMAMAETIETTPWINRWPDQPIRPPSRPGVAGTATDPALATQRGMVAGIMALILSLALLEILFGGTKLRTRLRFGRKDQDTPSRWGATRRVVPKTSSRSTQVGPIARKATLSPTFVTDRGRKRSRSDIMVK